MRDSKPPPLFLLSHVLTDLDFRSNLTIPPPLTLQSSLLISQKIGLQRGCWNFCLEVFTAQTLLYSSFPPLGPIVSEVEDQDSTFVEVEVTETLYRNIKKEKEQSEEGSGVRTKNPSERRI